MNPKRVVKADFVDQVIQAAIDFGAATDSVTDGAAGALGINRTDMRVLSLIRNRGPQPVGGVAKLAGLSPAAATTVVRRLTSHGYTTQVSDPSDARRTLVALSDLARERLRDLYGPMIEQGRGWLGRLTIDQLRLVQEFLLEAESLQLDLSATLQARRARVSR